MHNAESARPADTGIPATLIRGDGIGPEICEAAVVVLDALGAPFAWDEQMAGLAGVEAHNDPLPEATLASIRRTRLALKGPLETPSGSGYRSSNVRLRETFRLYANLRPVRTLLPGGRYEGIDLVIVRENLEGLYSGFDHYVAISDDPHGAAMGTGVNTRQGSRKLLEYAFEYAVAQGRRKVTVVHKANIMKALTGIFLETAAQLHAEKYADRIEFDTVIVDACAMKMVIDPWQFDVLATTNMFGDIISDLGAGLIGGLGLAPGANIGVDAAIFEAVHGSAPDIAGKGIANPTALLLAAALMLDHCRLDELATRLRKAIDDTLIVDRIRTGDLGGKLLLEALDMRCQTALMARGLVLVDQPAAGMAIQHRRHFRVRRLRGSLVLGRDGIDDFLDVGAQHRALRGVAGPVFFGLAGALASLNGVGQRDELQVKTTGETSSIFAHLISCQTGTLAVVRSDARLRCRDCLWLVDAALKQ